MKILYFAKYRSLLGRGEETLTIPAEVKNVRELITYLGKKDERVAQAFGDLATLKVAVNQVHAGLDTTLTGAEEVAFFPPVTGG